MNVKEKAIKESTKIIYHAKVICPIESRVEEDIIVGTRREALDILKEFRDTGEYEDEYYELDIEEENITNTSKALDIAIGQIIAELETHCKNMIWWNEFKERHLSTLAKPKEFNRDPNIMSN